MSTRSVVEEEAESGVVSDLAESGEEVRRVQALLRDDADVVRRYGEAHPDAWAGVRFENEPTVRLVASFAGDVDRHRSALRALVKHPERFLVERVPRSLADLRRLQDEILATAPRGAVSSVGPGTGLLHVGLQADQEALAEELAGRYGDALDLVVGAFKYPLPPTSAASEALSLRMRRYEPVVVTGLELKLHLDARVVVAGHRGRGRVVVRNAGCERVGPLHSGQPLAGVLVDEEGNEAGGLAPSWVAGAGMLIDLRPGEELTMPVVYGTASFRASWGYLVPPGRYRLSVQVRFQRSLPGVARHALSVAPEELTIVPRAAGKARRP